MVCFADEYNSPLTFWYQLGPELVKIIWDTLHDDDIDVSCYMQIIQYGSVISVTNYTGTVVSMVSFPYELSCRMCYPSNFSVCAISVFVIPAPWPVVDCCEDLSSILCSFCNIT